MHGAPKRTFTATTRRCSHQPSRFRWTVASSDGAQLDHATTSYATEGEALAAGRARAAELTARGYSAGR